MLGKKKEDASDDEGGSTSAVRSVARKMGVEENRLSHVAPGMKVDGDLVGNGGVNIAGEVEGDVRIEGAVVVAREGRVDGGVTAGEVEVFGRVEGTIRAGSRVDLRESCRVSGEVIAPAVTVEEGAVFNGRIDMRDEAVSEEPGGAGRTEGDGANESRGDEGPGRTGASGVGPEAGEDAGGGGA